MILLGRVISFLVNAFAIAMTFFVILVAGWMTVRLLIQAAVKLGG